MTPEQLKLLGLPEDATPEQITEALVKLQAGPVAELVEVKTELETTQAKLESTKTELANALVANPALEKFVPRADYDAVVASEKSAKAELATLATSAHTKEVETEIAAALASGKITPATKDFYVSTCADAEGLAKFREFVKAAASIGDPTDLDNQDPNKDTNKGPLTDAEKEIAKQCGLSEEEYAKSKTELAV